MVPEDVAPERLTRIKDRRRWRIGNATDVAWISGATTSEPDISGVVPTVFAAYATVALPERLDGAQRRHDEAVVAVLRAHTAPQPWWLGYLETGIGVEIVFYDVPRVELGRGWNYVLVEAGPEQAIGWRDSEGRRAEWKGALPDLMFPRDHSWLLTTMWDDMFSCVGGAEALVAGFADDPELGPRTRRAAPGESVWVARG